MKLSLMLLLSVGSMVLCLLAGCRLSEEDKDTIITVDPEFTVDLFEELGESPSFFLKIKTIESRDCLNDSIKYTAQRQTTRLILSINNIQEAPDCITGNNYINASAGFGHLGNGSYFMQIGLKNTLINKGKLTVSDQAYVIDMDREDGLAFIRSTLNRVPRKTIWGYVAYENHNAAGDFPQQFMDDLGHLCQQASLPAGDYIHFEVDDQGLLKLQTPPSYSFFKTFYHKFDGDFQTVEQLLEDYRSGPGGGNMEVKLFTSDGKVF